MIWLRWHFTEMATLLVLTVLAVQGSPWWWAPVTLAAVVVGRQEWRVRQRCTLATPSGDRPELEQAKEQRA